MTTSRNALGFPLLSDPGNRVAKRLGAYRWFLPGGLHTRRVTYLIGPDRRVIGTVASESRMEMHADKTLELLRDRNAR